MSFSLQSPLTSWPIYLSIDWAQKTPLLLAGPSICPLTEPEKPDLGGIDTHRHCFAAWYIALQNHTFFSLKSPPIFPIFDPFGNYPPRQTPYSHFVRK